SVLLWRVLVALRLQHFERLNQLLSRFTRLNDRVEESAVSGNVGVSEAVAKLLNFLLAESLAFGQTLRRIVLAGSSVLRRVEFALVDNIDCTFRSHNRDLRARPCVIHIGTNVLGRHDAISSTI